jgi:NADH-quinone oxidoreductase subunit F
MAKNKKIIGRVKKQNKPKKLVKTKTREKEKELSLINQDSLVEQGKKEFEEEKIFVGLATCGISAGGNEVFEKLKNANLGIPIKKTGCIGMCYNEPIVTVIKNGKKVIYGKVTEENVDKIIDSVRGNYICNEHFITENLEDVDYYKKQKRVVMSNCGIIEPLSLEQYLYLGGFSGLRKSVEMSPKEVIEKIKKAGLRGRGGGGFPTGIKWEFIAYKKENKFIICNGDEGDPGAFMNRTLLESDPFKVIEGMIIGAYAMGAENGVIYTRAEYPLAIETLKKAIDILYKNNLLGKDILGKKGFNFDLRVMQGAGAYVCGEETAMIRSIEGKRGNPWPKPPYPAQRGVFSNPTVVNNVETWAQVSVILKNGVEKYIKNGTEKTRGTKTICLTGKIKRNGVVEVPFGISLNKIIYDIGGGSDDGSEIKAVLTGGPSGGCIPKDKLNIPFDYESLKEVESILGSGGIIVTAKDTCMVNMAKYYLTFTQEESCGQCVPCREGTKRLLEMLIKITRGNGNEEDLKKLKELAEYIKENSLCGLGQFSTNPFISTLKHFKEEYLMHINEKKCPAHICEALLTYFILEDCVGCENCVKHCPVGAISGKPKERHVIDQEKCIKCGECFKNCAFKSIERK